MAQGTGGVPWHELVSGLLSLVCILLGVLWKMNREEIKSLKEATKTMQAEINTHLINYAASRAHLEESVARMDATATRIEDAVKAYCARSDAEHSQLWTKLETKADKETCRENHGN